MTTAIKKMARTAAFAAFVSAAALFGASNANALSVGNLTGGNVNLGNLDLATPGGVDIDLTGSILGTGSFSINTFVSAPFSLGLANFTILLKKLSIAPTFSTGTLTGTWGGNVITFSQNGGAINGNSDVAFTTIGLAGAKLLKINYTAFTAKSTLTGSLSAVPVPGAAMLLLSGLGGLGFLARRRRVAKV